MALDLAQSYPEMQIKCKETSATTKINVTEVFEELLHDIYNQRQKDPSLQSGRNNV
jgi:GTPase SAR1 family protein